MPDGNLRDGDADRLDPPVKHRAKCLLEEARKNSPHAQYFAELVIAQAYRDGLDARDAALRDARAEITKLQTAVSELESGYQNIMELSMTYHGQLERADAELACLRAAPASCVVEAALAWNAAHRDYDLDTTAETNLKLVETERALRMAVTALAERDAAPLDDRGDAAAERDVIVAWLRKRAEFYKSTDYEHWKQKSIALHTVADAIERGDHFQPELTKRDGE